jgi:extracellular factor (EF) 3-hydroxypalmitic acid methyl ester biosynthesis protein
MDAIESLQEAAERVSRLPATGPPGWLRHKTMAALHDLLACACAAAEVGRPLEEMRQATAVARRFYGRHSRILAHTQTWPRGYPGDFELIERLLDVTADGEPGTIEHALDACVLQLPIVWQHRAKIAWQARLLRRCLGGATDIRMLSIACGGSRDLMLLEPHELSRIGVVLADLDAAALQLSSARLTGRVRDLTLVPGNVFRTVNRVRAAGPFDVILIGGLLDYLPDRAARGLLDHAVTMLAAGGALGATNIAAGNPWRLMLDLIADWTLIERDGAEMRRLVSFPDLSSNVAPDDSRLAWLATVAA